jgi:WD40 repeat protein
MTASLGGSEDGGDSVFVDRVVSLAFSPDGSLLAAGGGEASRSGQLTLWNAADGTLVREFPNAHSDTVYGIEFSPDGKFLASAAADKFVKVFNVASGEFVRAFEGHTHHVMDVSWKGDGTSLASAGADNAIKVWNVETGEQARTIATYTRQVTSLQFVGMQDLFVSSSGDKRVFFHTASNGNPAREFKGSTDYVYRAATNPDGTLVVSGGEDGSVRVWNAADAVEIANFVPQP